LDAVLDRPAVTSKHGDEENLSLLSKIINFFMGIALLLSVTFRPSKRNFILSVANAIAENTEEKNGKPNQREVSTGVPRSDGPRLGGNAGADEPIPPAHTDT
jgi:hypothetical protein